jgi:hypothetical protein
MWFSPMQLSRRTRILVSIWAVLIVPGCSRSALSTDQTAELAAAEDRWKQSALHDYSFEIHPYAALSFGHNAGRIEVRGGVVKTVTPLGFLDPPRATVDELFASIRHASKSGRYEKIAVTYHPKLGYPTQIVYTARKEISDGNWSLKITELKDLAGQ